MPATTVETARQTIEKLDQPEGSRISKVIAVMSGKGGVGKSSVAALLATGLAREGYSVALLDADVTGPSIPKLFGLQRNKAFTDDRLLPEKTRLGIRVMSLNLLLDREDLPVVWRGPLISSAVKQFWTDVVWGKIDYMVIDLPPGTGDVSLTVLQSLPVDGVVVVTTPQDLSQMIVRKSVNMVRMLNVPILGIVENMAWVKCAHCGERIEPFGSVDAAEMAERMDLPLLGAFPLDPRISEMGDHGAIEECRSQMGGELTALIMKRLPVSEAASV
ncbi:MAG: Mrp/NBP35 family ATP-binding protein [Bacillota bacterium]